MSPPDPRRCVGQDPALFDLDVATEAQRAIGRGHCLFCPAAVACLASALLAGDVGVIRGGVEFWEPWEPPLICQRCKWEFVPLYEHSSRTFCYRTHCKADYDHTPRPCAASPCTTTIVPQRADHYYCSTECRRRQSSRRARERRKAAA